MGNHITINLKKLNVNSESLDFWTLSIVRNSKQTENILFRKLDVSVFRWEEGTVIEVSFRGLNRVGVSLPSPEDGKRSSFRNVVFSSYLEFINPMILRITDTHNRSYGEILWTRLWSFRLYTRKRGISWPADRLSAYEEGRCSAELIPLLIHLSSLWLLDCRLRINFEINPLGLYIHLDLLHGQSDHWRPCTQDKTIYIVTSTRVFLHVPVVQRAILLRRLAEMVDA
jgi:hypothetical protein